MAIACPQAKDVGASLEGLAGRRKQGIPWFAR